MDKTLSKAAQLMGRRGGRKQSAAQRTHSESLAAAAAAQLRVPCIPGSDHHRYIKGTCTRCGIKAVDSIRKFREAQTKLKAKWEAQ
jgi:hypothetical protein